MEEGRKKLGNTCGDIKLKIKKGSLKAGSASLTCVARDVLRVSRSFMKLFFSTVNRTGYFLAGRFE